MLVLTHIMYMMYMYGSPVSHHLLTTILQPLLKLYMDDIHTVNLPYALQVLAVPNLSIAMTHSSGHDFVAHLSKKCRGHPQQHSQV